jgi:polyhydroxyalkanoate synthesis repressor PhaR
MPSSFDLFRTSFLHARMPLIKRYPNRKLYDTESKRYVTLDDIAAMIRMGNDIQVSDHESGEDVTTLTLTQIILEQEKKSAGYLPHSLLTNLIRSGGSTLDQWRKSLQQGVANLGGVGRLSGAGLEEHMAKLIEQGKLSVEQAQGLLKLDTLLADILHALNVPTQSDINTLRTRIEELNAKLGELEDSSFSIADEGDASGEESAGVDAPVSSAEKPVDGEVR